MSDEKKTIKKKNKKHSSGSKSDHSYSYFNNRPFKKSALLTFEIIKEEAIKVSRIYDIELNVWGTSERIYKGFSHSWELSSPERELDHFCRWWADRLVQEFAFMIWNQVVEKNIKTNRPETIADIAFLHFEKKFK